jgi:glycosyltransferase involved in cell wall biosynthesis
MMKEKILTIWLPVLRAGSGVDVFTVRLAERLEKAGHKPVLQWFDHRLEPFADLLTWIRPPTGIDLVHTTTWQGFAFKQKGIPLIVTEHHGSLHPQLALWQSRAQRLYHRYLVQRWNRKSYRLADRIVAVSEFTAAPLRKNWGEKLEVIYNGIDIHHFRPAEYYKRGEKFRLLFVGNPSLRKGFDVLTPLSRNLGKHFEIQCMGGLRHSCAEMTEENIRFLPSVKPADMPGVYQSADAVLMPTRHDSFSYVALEAQACGIPVVGFNQSGTSEACVNNETALLSAVDDMEALAANIGKLAGDDALYQRLSQNARNRAVTALSEETWVSRYIDLYQRVINEHAAKGAA